MPKRLLYIYTLYNNLKNLKEGFINKLKLLNKVSILFYIYFIFITNLFLGLLY